MNKSLYCVPVTDTLSETEYRETSKFGYWVKAAEAVSDECATAGHTGELRTNYRHEKNRKTYNCSNKTLTKNHKNMYQLQSLSYRP